MNPQDEALTKQMIATLKALESLCKTVEAIASRAEKLLEAAAEARE